MPISYRDIPPELARRTRLLMTDVDGTLTAEDGSIDPSVPGAVRRLEDAGITVGLVSGRNLPRLDALAVCLATSGPIIAENGALARVAPGSDLFELGHSRQPSLDALARLKRLYPGNIREREDNAVRLVDVVFWADGVTTNELREHTGDVQVLDSGYILHLMPPGISKGATLLHLLRHLGDGDLSPDDLMVFGDSATDLSLFELFTNSVLIPNPLLNSELTIAIDRAAGYTSQSPAGTGFSEVAHHLADLRRAV